MGCFNTLEHRQKKEHDVHPNLSPIKGLENVLQCNVFVFFHSQCRVVGGVKTKSKLELYLFARYIAVYLESNEQCTENMKIQDRL